MSPWSREHLADLLATPAIGMIHLAPLPGSPGWAGDLGRVVDRARRDADTLTGAGFGAIMVENFHDVPFFPGRVPPATTAAMTAILSRLRADHPGCRVGVNVLRNDAEAALGIAAATGADFIRVNVHVGAAVTDQGPIEGRAWRTLRLRRDLGLGDRVGILADVRVKHAAPLVERPLVDEAKDLRLRGLADAIIVSGCATGSDADPQELRAIREALPDCPLLVGSGMTASNLPLFTPWADAYIVGTSLQETDETTAERVVSGRRATEFLAALAADRTGG